MAGLLNGITPVFASEIEPFPILVTRKRLPCVKHYGDVSKLSGAELEPVDIITFGSPCQDLSVAGKRAGIHEGERSSLFFQAVRIIREMRAATGGKYPRYAVWENVMGCFSSNYGEDFRAVLQALVEVKHEGVSIPRPKKWERAGAVVGDGFSLAWRTLGAEHWGVPQRRNRIYLVTDFDGGRAGEIFFEPDSLQRNPGEGGKTREAAAGGAGKAADNPGGLIVLNDQGGSAMSVSRDVTGTLRAQEHQHQPLVLAFKQGQGAKSGNGIAAFAQNQRGEVRDLGEKSAALQARPGVKQRTYVLQGSMIGRAEKNGPQGGGINEGVSFTLNTADRHAVAAGPGYTVRRLTPKECARLQGFPNWWCDDLAIPDPSDEELAFWAGVWQEWDSMRGKKPKTERQVRKWLAAPYTDAAAYKMYGNGIALPCATFVLGAVARKGGMEGTADNGKAKISL